MSDTEDFEVLNYEFDEQPEIYDEHDPRVVELYGKRDKIITPKSWMDIPFFNGVMVEDVAVSTEIFQYVLRTAVDDDVAIRKPRVCKSMLANGTLFQRFDPLNKSYFEEEYIMSIVENIYEKDRRIVIFTGPPGSGKTSLSKVMHYNLGGALISTDKRLGSASHKVNDWVRYGCAEVVPYNMTRCAVVNTMTVYLIEKSIYFKRDPIILDGCIMEGSAMYADIVDAAKRHMYNIVVYNVVTNSFEVSLEKTRWTMIDPEYLREAHSFFSEKNTAAKPKHD